MVLAIPGFRAELGKYSKPTLQNTINYRMSYSFSASASVSKLTDNQEIKIVYADYKLDHVDNDANFYRKFFYKQGIFSIQIKNNKKVNSTQLN